MTVTLAESELIYKLNITLEVKVTHSFWLIMLSCLGVSTSQLETTYLSWVHHMYVHTLSMPCGTRGDSWSSLLLEVYTLFEDKCMHTILMPTSLLTLLTDMKMHVKAVNLNLDGCQSAIWMPHIVILMSMMLIRIQGHWCCTGDEPPGSVRS